MKKKIAGVILAGVACIALLAFTAEAETEMGQFLLSGGSMAIFAICAKGMEKIGMFNEE